MHLAFLGRVMDNDTAVTLGAWIHNHGFGSGGKESVYEPEVIRLSSKEIFVPDLRSSHEVVCRQNCGSYNGSQRKIKGMLLHCSVTPQNAFKGDFLYLLDDWLNIKRHQGLPDFLLHCVWWD